MKRIFLLTLACCLSCTSLKNRRPAQDNSLINSFINQAREIKDLVAKRELNPDTCEDVLSRINENYSNISSGKISLDQMKIEGEQVLNENFEARLALHSMLEVFPNVCRLN